MSDDRRNNSIHEQAPEVAQVSDKSENLPLDTGDPAANDPKLAEKIVRFMFSGRWNGGA